MSTDLTDEDRAAIVKAHVNAPYGQEREEIYLAGKRAGRRDGMKEAAKVCRGMGAMEALSE